MHQACQLRLQCTLANMRESFGPSAILHGHKRSKRLTLTRDWQPPCQIYWLDRTVNNIVHWWSPVWEDGSWTIGSWGPAPGRQQPFATGFAELTSKGIHTTTYFFPYLNLTGPKEFVSEYPGTPNVGPYWSENMEFFRAWWEDPNILVSADFEFNDCTKHQVCT
jgi:hypothetical protein